MMLLPAALAAFRVRSFRFQWPADLLISWAIEMEMLILGWYVLVETGSVLLLTLFASLLYIGTLVAPMMGVIGDRVGHRTVLFATRTSYMVLAATIASLSFAGMLSPVYVFIAASLAGLLRTSDIGVRSALVAATVPPYFLIGAMSISRTTADSARIMGALTGAGLFVAFGMGPAYVAITCFYALGTMLLFGAGPESKPAAGAPHTSPWRDLLAGIAYIWNAPRLLAAMWLAFLINMCAFPLVTGLMPHVAKSVYGTDQTGFGYLVASLAAGALCGSIALSIAGERMRVERIMIASMVAWYVSLIAFGQVNDMTVGIGCLFIIGVAQGGCMVTLAVILLRTAAPQYRGRVMGVRMLAIYGNPVGLLAAGVLIERIGYAATAFAYGAVGLVFTFIVLLHWRVAVFPARAPSAS
ncbi:MAG: MFS transporter [Betaproteobacteria bacterium]|nr:MFS transporter [Betaproteobacteria bacterium]